jgi:hypothetical protein
VTAGRETHYANVVGVYLPGLGAVAHGCDGVVCVAEGDVSVAVRHAIGEYAVGDALGVEVIDPVIAFVLHCEVFVSAAGAVYNSSACWVFGEENFKSGSAVR